MTFNHVVGVDWDQSGKEIKNWLDQHGLVIGLNVIIQIYPTFESQQDIAWMTMAKYAFVDPDADVMFKLAFGSG